MKMQIKYIKGKKKLTKKTMTKSDITPIEITEAPPMLRIKPKGHVLF